MSKYVFVLSFEKYAPKLQKNNEIESYKVKKVTKRDKISPFEGQKGIKTTKLMAISYGLDMHYSGFTQVPYCSHTPAILTSKAKSSLEAGTKQPESRLLVWLSP